MKKQNKTKWIDKHYILVIFLFGILVVGAAVYLKYTPKYWCQVNPDKCVCEEYFYKKCIEDIQSYPEKSEERNIVKENCDKVVGCKQFRLKTPAELDIDYCNSCNYGYWRTNFGCKKRLKIHYVSQELCNEAGGELTGKNCDNSCVCEQFSTTDKTTVYGGETPIEYPHCIKSHPKTECEKGNPDWVEETKIEKIYTSIVPHPECKLQTGWFCPAIGIVDLPCDNSTNTCLLESGLYYVGCGYEEDICIANQTICREKTLCDHSDVAFCVEMNDSAPNNPSPEPQIFVVGEIK